MGELKMNLHNEARGFRNNNPGNIRHSKDSWKGLLNPNNEDRYFLCNDADKSFCQFENIEYGIRAIYKILDTYNTKYGINTIEKIIYRWAPPKDKNDTKAYVDAIVQFMNEKNGYDELMHVPLYTQKSIVDGRNSGRFIQAMIRYENGYCPLTVGFIKHCENFED